MKILVATVILTVHTASVFGRIIPVGDGCARPEEIIDGMAEQNAEQAAQYTRWCNSQILKSKELQGKRRSTRTSNCNSVSTCQSP
ncbi:hypothetical protein LPJ66_004130, partial [Kickxella alabastrina]